MRVVEGQEIIDSYFKRTFKPTEKIIGDNQSFFAGLADIDEILVMGHSLADVDHAYFYEILRHINRNKVLWKVSYYGNSNDTQKRFSVFGIDPTLVQYFTLPQF